MCSSLLRDFLCEFYFSRNRRPFFDKSWLMVGGGWLLLMETLMLYLGKFERIIIYDEGLFISRGITCGIVEVSCKLFKCRVEPYINMK